MFHIESSGFKLKDVFLYWIYDNFVSNSRVYPKISYNKILQQWNEALVKWKTDLSLAFAHFLGNHSIDGKWREEEEYSNQRHPTDIQEKKDYTSNNLMM